MTTPQPAALPELPDPSFTYERHPGGFSEPERIGAYTADQMDARYLQGYNDALAALQAQAAAVVSDEQIRDVFLANGFTIKDGLADLKPYVYAAARALLALRPQAVPMTEWQPLDAARLNSEEFDGAYWLAMKNGVVSVGEYEWRQGWNPHGFNLIDGGRVGPSDVTHTARFTRPVHPSHGITAQGAQTKE